MCHIVHCMPSIPLEHLFTLPSGRLVHLPSLMGPGWSEALTHEEKLAGETAGRLERRFGKQLDRHQVPHKVHILREAVAADKGGIGALLADQAEQLQAAAVVVASHSRGGLSELLMGSVANYLTHNCSRPVAVLHAAPKSKAARQQDPAAASSSGASAAAVAGSSATGAGEAAVAPSSPVRRNLVVAVDGSDASVMACHWALDHLYRAGDTMHLVHIIPCIPPSIYTSIESYNLALGSMPGSETVPMPQEVQEQEAEAWRQEQGRKYSALLEEAGANFTFDIMVQYTQDPVTSISEDLCGVADKLDAAAVVMAAHKHSALAELLFGSVANHVAHHCSKPVIMLHPK